jgi:RNA polymerase sigma-70 factor (ECF subfamily)
LLRNNDQAAFTALYDRYWKKMLIRSNMLLNSFHDAEEIVHDIFVTLWRKRNTISIDNGFHTYLAAMLQYACFKKLADNKRKRHASVNGELPDPGDHSTTEFIDFENLRKEIEGAVSRLPEKCQLIFRMSREHGLTDKQIAGELDISVHTVRTQMQRALRSLKTSMNNFFLL